jgi:hypothetical protein
MVLHVKCSFVVCKYTADSLYSTYGNFAVLCIIEAVRRRFPDVTDKNINDRLCNVLATAGDREQGRKQRASSLCAADDDNTASPVPDAAAAAQDS